METREFESLCEKHRRAMLAYTFTCCRDRALAEDIVQDALVIAYRKREQYFPEADFGAWLISIARNVWFREREKRQKAGVQVPMCQAIDANASLLFASELYADEVWEARREALRKCLDHLKEEDRRLIRTYFVERRRYGEMAGMMKRTLSWVKVRMLRIRAALMECTRRSLARAGDVS
ncbi:MAG: hypothetical protein C0404_09350 [Verrucomicrobia bacterium]|nr:hypothetical protein [Verrucomicrobiota bacterium]